jgi:hypothetical protein
LLEAAEAVGAVVHTSMRRLIAAQNFMVDNGMLQLENY